MKRKKPTVSILLTLFFLISMLFACTPHMMNHLIEGAVISTAVIGTAIILEHHDSHFHHLHCGCPRHYHEGRWVYYYHERWEYYDPDDREWFIYTPHRHHHRFHY